MSLAIRLVPEVIRSLPFNLIGNVYMGVGTAVTRPIRIIQLQNLTNADMMFSFNGIDDHMVLTSLGYMILDIASNKTIDQGFFLAQGQRLYVRQLDPAQIPLAGSVYFSTFYGTEL